MLKEERQNARIFVICNFIIFELATIFNIIDSLKQSVFPLGLIYIPCWFIISMGMWKVIDIYERNRIRNLNLSFLILNIFYVAITFLGDSVYSILLFCLGIFLVIGMAVWFYKKYRDKNKKQK